MKEDIPLSTEENKATFRRYVEEVGNEGNLDLVDEAFDRYLSHQLDGHTEERGPENVKRFMGEFRGIAPTGEQIMVAGINIFRFSDEGKVVENWDNFDQLGMMRQLGAIPSP